jgi:hypothetical protein
MKFQLITLCALSAAVTSFATDRYVSLNGTNDSGHGYTNWIGAATNIQYAIDACSAGDIVWVSNGVYNVGGRNYPSIRVMTNRVLIDKAITVRSFNNNPTNTIIQGAYDPSTPEGTNGRAAVRCVLMVDGASLIGFTLTNGASSTENYTQYGGGVYCATNYGEDLYLITNTIISNCVITSNLGKNSAGGAYGGTFYNCTFVGNKSYAYYGGGGAYHANLFNCTLVNNSSVYGGGAMGGTLVNCTIISNSAIDGGSAAGVSGSICYNCAIVGNCSTTTTYLGGAGALDATLINCIIASNCTTMYGGGTSKNSSGCILSNCTLIGNSGVGRGGGDYGGTLYNCLVAGNSVTTNSLGYNYGGGTYASMLYNCTVVGNSAGYGGGVYGSTSVNCIVYFNTVTNNNNGSNWYATVVFSNSCTTPAVGGWAAGNITNDPMFVDSGSGYGTNLVVGNYRLKLGSPGINAGQNQVWMNGTSDLDGHHRLDVYSRIVDMGCYEYLPSGMMVKIP